MEFKKRLDYFIASCKMIHKRRGPRKYRLEFTYYADWHPEEFEEITASVVEYKGVQPETEDIPIYNNTNYRYLMPSMDPCDGNAELRELVSKPQNCSVSWAFSITNSIEYAIKKMYFEDYDQIVEVSLSTQELIVLVKMVKISVLSMIKRREVVRVFRLLLDSSMSVAMVSLTVSSILTRM